MLRKTALLALGVSALVAQDGAALYKSRCAQCHDAPAAQAGQLALVAAVVPVVLVSVPSSSPAQHAAGAPPSQSSVLARAPAALVNGVHPPPASVGANTMTVAPALQVPAPPVALPSDSVQGATSTINRAVEDLKRSVGLPAPTPPSPTLPH